MRQVSEELKLFEGESFYFLDPDGNKLEIHYRTLEHRLEWAKENKGETFNII